jgi:hypothetical protein
MKTILAGFSTPPFASPRLAQATSGCNLALAGAHLALRHRHLLQLPSRTATAPNVPNGIQSGAARHKMSRTGGDPRLA